MRKKTYLKLVEYQTEQSEKHLSEVRSIHKEMRGYKHDFHHHLQTLKGQLEAGEIERALAYIAQLDDQLMNVDTLLKTGNISLDAINLNSSTNIRTVTNHMGRHTSNYHQFVLQKVRSFDVVAAGNKAQFMKYFNKLADYIVTHPEIMYK